MNLNYPVYLQRLRALVPIFLALLGARDFHVSALGDFPSSRKGVSERLDRHFFVWLWGYEIPAGDDKRDNNLHVSRQQLTLYCGVSLSKVLNSRHPFIRTFLRRCSDTMIDVAMGGHLRIEINNGFQ